MYNEPYIILQESSTVRLQEMVNEHTEYGYIPQGGVAVVYTNSGVNFEYTQAMIFKDK